MHNSCPGAWTSAKFFTYVRASPEAQLVKNPPAMQET